MACVRNRARRPSLHLTGRHGLGSYPGNFDKLSPAACGVFLFNWLDVSYFLRRVPIRAGNQQKDISMPRNPRAAFAKRKKTIAKNKRTAASAKPRAVKRGRRVGAFKRRRARK